MKTYILVVLLLLGVNTLTKAQKIPTAQEMTVKSVNELDKRLKLSSTQKSIIYNYTFDMSKQQIDLVKRQQAGTSNEDDVTKFYKLQNETDNNIRSLLKGDQIAEFDKILEDRANGIDGTVKKKKKKGEKEEIVTGISGLKMP